MLTTVPPRTKLLILTGLATSFMLVAPAIAQRPRLLLPRAGQPRLGQPPQEEIIAAVGSPFGVGKLTIMLPRGAAVSSDPGNEYTLAEKNGRALYSAFSQGPARGLLRQIL